ncbi:23172_t:CDS:2, partial [Gigaspora margarita]
KMPQWFQKLEQTVLENKITRSIKEAFIQVDKINKTQIKQSGKEIPNKKMHILEWEETNKKNLSHNSPLRSSIVPTSKILKVKENEVEDVKKEESFEHLTLCEVDEARWLEEEFLIENQIWSNLDTVVRKRMTIENLYTNLTSSKTRFLGSEPRNLTISTSNLTLGNGDYQKIAKWKKQIDINPKKKKMKKVNSESSEEKKKKNSIGKGIDKGGEGNHIKESRTNPEDKRWKIKCGIGSKKKWDRRALIFPTTSD